MALGSTYVRAIAQHLRRIADRQRFGDRGQFARAQVHAKRVWSLAQQCCNAIALARLLCLQLRNSCFNRCKARVGAYYVQFVADTGIAQLSGYTLRLLLVGQVVPGDGFAQLRTAQLPIGIDHLGDQRDLQLIQIGFGSLLVGVAGLQLSLNASEQVQLPRHVQAQIVTFAVDTALGDAWLLAFAEVTAGPAGHHRHDVVGDVIANRPCSLEAGKCDAQITVAVQ